MSSLCFTGDNSNGHSHSGNVTITIDLWDGASWINVFETLLEDSEEIQLSSVSVDFTNIASVSMLRIASDPGQGTTFHGMDELFFHFGCDVQGPLVKGCFIKSENY